MAVSDRMRRGQRLDRGPPRPDDRDAPACRAKHSLVGLAAVFIGFNAHVEMAGTRPSPTRASQLSSGRTIL